MFDLITGQTRHLPSHSALPIAISSAAEAVVLTMAVALPVLFITDRIPAVPTMMAFVAAPPAPSLPAPPPPPAPAAGKKRAPTAPVPVSAQLVAPLAAPEQIGPGAGEGEDEGFEEGVPGGVEGGVPGGVLGGVLGEALDVSLTPPPPAPPAPRGPVRVGGQIAAPTLLHRVEPIYPPVAVSAHLEGAVILEATVDASGLVTGVKIVRSAGALLDNAARAAVEQWRYAPLELNGIKTRFLLTVVLRFNLERA